MSLTKRLWYYFLFPVFGVLAITFGFISYPTIISSVSQKHISCLGTDISFNAARYKTIAQECNDNIGSVKFTDRLGTYNFEMYIYKQSNTKLEDNTDAGIDFSPNDLLYNKDEWQATDNNLYFSKTGAFKINNNTKLLSDKLERNFQYNVFYKNSNNTFTDKIISNDVIVKLSYTILSDFAPFVWEQNKNDIKDLINNVKY
jgi:hypothetical protein